MDNPKTDKEKTLLSMPNTPITLSALQHEVAALKELLMTEVMAVKEGIKIAHDDMVRFPTEVDKRVGNLDRVMEIKIGHRHEVVELHVKHIEDKLVWIEKGMAEEKANKEKLRASDKTDYAVNLAAALSSAKELVTVNSLNTTKQIDQLALLVTTMGTGLNDKITDIKDRVTVIEGRGSGMGTLWGVLIAAAIVLIGILNYMK